MPKIPRKQTLSYLVRNISDMEDRVRVSGRGTSAGRKRLLDFLKEVRETVRAFCPRRVPGVGPRAFRPLCARGPWPRIEDEDEEGQGPCARADAAQEVQEQVGHALAPRAPEPPRLAGGGHAAAPISVHRELLGEVGLALTNYVRQRPLSASIEDLAILEKLEAWTTSDELRRGLANGARAGLRRRLAVLHRHGLLNPRTRPPIPWSGPPTRAAPESRRYLVPPRYRDVRYASRGRWTPSCGGSSRPSPTCPTRCRRAPDACSRCFLSRARVSCPRSC